jgi:GNAT superfamily N-acetyltransferase
MQWGNYIVIKAVTNDIIIGSVRASVTKGTCFIGKLIVHPDYQGKGIGKILMAEIEGFYTISRYELFTGNKSEKNIRLYH